MKLLQNSSIRQKLTAIVMLTSSLALFVACLVFVIADQMSARDKMVSNLDILAEILGANSAAAITFGIYEDATDVLNALEAEPHIISAHIHTLDGKEFASYHRNNDTSAITHESQKFQNLYYFGSDYLYLSKPIIINNKLIGHIYLEQDLTELSAQVNDFLFIIAVVFILAALVSFAAISRLQKVISEPIVHLSGVAREVFEKQDYSIRASQFSNDELGFLTNKFNEMLADIQQRDTELQDARNGLEKRVKERTVDLENEISKRQKAEYDLLEAQEFLEAAVAQSPAGILIADAPDVTIRLANSAAFGIRGGDKGILTSIDVSEHAMKWQTYYPDGSIYAPEDLPLSRAVLNGEVTRDEELIIRNDKNNDRWVSANAAPIKDSEGNVTAGIVVFNDITDRKTSEDQKKDLQRKLDRAEKMESLGILAGGVAHDLNNMLGPIVGFSELILIQATDNENVTKKVTRIAKSAQDAADVIQDLLTLARRGRYEMIPTDLNEIINDYLESPGFEKLTNDNPGIQLILELDKSIGQLMGSSAHLSKVIMNLIVNAYDAMQDSGKLSISTYNQHLEKLPNGHELKNKNGEYIVFSVSDTGKGIDPEHKDKIFEPYYSKKKMGNSSGSGLGLSVVYGVLKDHNGYYDIISSPDEGTTFQLFFPVTVGAKTIEKEIDRGELKGTESVLVVDDNDDQRDVAVELLNSLGYSVKSVSSGEKAIEYFKNNTADIVLLDMIMQPGIDGLDTYKEIIKLHSEQKAIVASGFSSTKRVEEMQKLGAGPYIKKPFTLNQLGKAIRDELDKSTVQLLEI